VERVDAALEIIEWIVPLLGDPADDRGGECLTL
jgi:hypothetical protein